MESHLKGECEDPPPLDLRQCRFEMWLGTKGLVRYRAQPAFEAIKLLHRQVHVLGAELCELHARGRNPEALAGLEELRGMQDALLKQLKTLVLDNRQ